MPERQEHNEEMRHVPSLDWIVTKLDYDYRDRVNKLWSATFDRDDLDPKVVKQVEERMEAVCKWLRRLIVLARGSRAPQYGENSDLRTSLIHAGYEAVSALSSLDRDTFRRRTPFQTMDQSVGWDGRNHGEK